MPASHLRRGPTGRFVPVEQTGTEYSPLAPLADCPMCGAALRPEHAHQRCPDCGWRDSCCD